MLNLTSNFALQDFASFGIAIHGVWIPAIPAGMTVPTRHLCITKSVLRGNEIIYFNPSKYVANHDNH